MRKQPQAIQEAMDLTIDPEEILYVVTEMTRRHDKREAPDWFTSIGVLVERYPGDVERVFCITERMRCLVQMMKDSRMRRWTVDAKDPSCSITNEAVFRAAAKCPLVLRKKRMSFDADEFFRIVLEESDSEGTA